MEILKLPGIGEYTSSAISSICFNDKQVTIDGNVLRVYTRFYNDKRNVDENKTKKSIHDDLLKILPSASGKFNQGMMELGETICLPSGEPLCKICPLVKDCLARKKGTYLTLPVKSPKREKQLENYTVLLYLYQEKVAIYKRKEETLLKNLWSFPTLSENLSIKKLENYLEKQNITYQKIVNGPTYTHIFTHKKWNMTSYIIKVSKISNLSSYHWVKKKELENTYAIPTAYQPFKKVVMEQKKIR